MSRGELIDGRNKFFFFASYSTSNETIPGRNQPQVTIPTSNHLNGDFSDLLRLPNASQYQIYDPLTVRPDPVRPGKFIRTPFPNNMIPKDRFMNPDGTYKNPLFGLYAAMLPSPNQSPASATVAPVNNYCEGAQPNLNTYTQGALRLDATFPIPIAFSSAPAAAGTSRACSIGHIRRPIESFTTCTATT